MFYHFTLDCIRCAYQLVIKRICIRLLCMCGMTLSVCHPTHENRLKGVTRDADDDECIESPSYTCSPSLYKVKFKILAKTNVHF